MKINLCLSLILLSSCVVTSYPASEWRVVSIQLRRTIGSAYEAARVMGVTFTDMISALERINPEPNTNEYRVKFKATSSAGFTKHCTADVKWVWSPASARIVSNERCWSQKG